MKLNTKTIAVVLCIVVALSGPGWSMMIDLTEDGLDMEHGNLGTSLIINEVLEISGLTGIDQSRGPFVGTVYLEKGDKGLGIRTLSGGGSKPLSGRGPDADEAILFGFVGGVDAGSLLVGLNKYKYDKDDPVITLSLSGGTELSFTESHANWAEAVNSQGKEKVVVDMGVLLGPGFSGAATGLSVTETRGHLYVNSLSYSVPEPTTIAMLSFGWMLLLSKRKREVRA